MASATKISAKRLAISRSNTQMVIVTAVASFITVFCLVAAQTVLSQVKYQSRLISASQKAHSQLQTNINSFNNLSSSYNKFVSNPTNVIGGQANGTSQNDGNNAKIILDALPSTYDFPALAASMQNLMAQENLPNSQVGGTDDQLAQQANTTSPSPAPVPIPFSLNSSDASYGAIQTFMTTLQNSIRPIQVDTMSLNGGSNDMTLSVTAHTYYQPAKKLTITKEAVK